jgi:hypothetical protein
MRSIAITAVALAMLAASASANYCYFNTTSGNATVNLNGIADYHGTAAGYTIFVSPCATVNTTDCGAAFGTVSRGQSVSCFNTAPKRTFTTVGNVTTTSFVFDSQTTTLAMLMQGATVRKLRTKYVCDPAATNVTEGPASYSAVTYELTITFYTAAACPIANTPAPTPAPTPGSDDDGNKLSTWAIVGIIAGCVVAIVVVGFVCFKCRSGDSQAEGEYARV